MSIAAETPQVVDLDPHKSTIAGIGEHSHLGALISCGQAYGHWSINVLDTSLDRTVWEQNRLQWERFPRSCSEPSLTREDALDLARQWVTGAITRDELHVAAEAAKQPR